MTSAGSFYEGGIDVTQLIPDVVLHQLPGGEPVLGVGGRGAQGFALGSFPLCGVEINTVPVPDDEIGIGESISDQATVTGTGLNAPPPTGTVDFVCGPLAAGAVCDTGGTLVSTEDLDGVNNPSIVTSDLFTPNEAGRWCFRGEYSR